MSNLFKDKLLLWYDQSNRAMPWKGVKDPYVIWLSEIILQQTRVEQGMPYFERFIEAYPKVENLANAPEDEVLKLWQGLGYYSRARNMMTTAKYIAHELGGVFPQTFAELVKLKGVGEYTAAAIASFAYNLPHPVVDGNVYRVLSRYHGIDTPIDSTEGKKQFKALAHELLDKAEPGRYNQAIMDFGATHCKPKAPFCTKCLLKDNCVGFQNKTLHLLPVKSKKIKHRTRFFHFFVVADGADTLITKRTEKDIWQDLYQFPLLETEKELDNRAEYTPEILEKVLGKGDWTLDFVSKEYRQTLTHQKIRARFVHITGQIVENKPENHRIPNKKLPNFAFPKIIDHYFKDKTSNFNLEIQF